MNSHINKIFIIIFCYFNCLPCVLQAGGPISDDPIVFSALISLSNGSSGSGFYINDNKYLYFVTANHVLYKKINNTISLQDNNATILSYSRNKHLKITTIGQLNILDNTNNIKTIINKDIAIIRLASLDANKIMVRKGVLINNPDNAILTSTHLTSLKQYDNVSIGSDIYIFGFPTSIGIQQFPQIEYEKPLLRKGILAGKNDISKKIILDCFVYWGNSGGPVLDAEEVSIGGRKYNIIGVITQFVPLVNKWEDIQKQSKLEVTNSGYSIAEPVDEIINIINNW